MYMYAQPLHNHNPYKTRIQDSFHLEVANKFLFVKKDIRTDNVKTVYPQQSLQGGIITVGLNQFNGITTPFSAFALVSKIELIVW